MASDTESGLLQTATAWLRATRTRWRWLRPALGALLLALGLLFVAQAMHGQFSQLPVVASAISWQIYAIATLLATTTVILTTALHAIVISNLTSAKIDLARVRYAYAASQVARYVPGKVFGVFLEMQLLTPALNLRQVLTATLIQTILIYSWAGGVSMVLLGALATGHTWLLLLAPPMLASLWLIQRNRWLERIGDKLISSVRSTEPGVPPIVDSRRNAWMGTWLLAVQWMPFFGIWILLSPEHNLSVACWLGASYLLASILGSIMVLLPSGLLVREATFVWLATLYGLPTPYLVTWAIVVRLALTIADVLAVFLLWLVARRVAAQESRVSLPDTGEGTGNTTEQARLHRH